MFKHINVKYTVIPWLTLPLLALFCYNTCLVIPQNIPKEPFWPIFSWKRSATDISASKMQRKSIFLDEELQMMRWLEAGERQDCVSASLNLAAFTITSQWNETGGIWGGKWWWIIVVARTLAMKDFKNLQRNASRVNLEPLMHKWKHQWENLL